MKKSTLAVLLLAVALLIAGPITGYARGGKGGGGGGHSSGGHSGGGRTGSSHGGGGNIGSGHIGGGHVGGAHVGGYRAGGRVVIRGWSGWSWWPWFWGGALFAPRYAPPPVEIQEQPLIEIEPDEEQPYYWYYCQNPQGYYPYVKSCPSEWIEIDPDATPLNPEEGAESRISE
jgi:hypothetical protein